MKVRYVLGNAGSGKFYDCVENILNREEKGLESILIIPEQFTLQAEKKLIEKSKNKIVFNTHVLNFKRLAYRIFSELGIAEKTPLEDVGKIMVLRKILYSLGKKNRLMYFSESSYSNIGLLEKISIILQEFSEFGIDKLILENAINNINQENLNLKLKDLSIIYEDYKNFTKNEYITDEDVLEILSEKIEASSLVKEGTHIFVYGFETFNFQEIGVLCKLFEKCKMINFYFTLNTKQTFFQDINPFDPYYHIKNTLNKIDYNIVKKLNASLDEILFLEDNKRHIQNEELQFLEKNFFSYFPEKFLKTPKNIMIFENKNKYLEIEKTSKTILKLVKESKYNFKDIVIILGDDTYQKPLKMIFNKYSIPYFLDDKKSITNHPLVELIISALDIIIYNFQYDSIFKCLKTGFLEQVDNDNINYYNIALIENYILEYGIKGNKWKNAFKYGFYENSMYKEEHINCIRTSIVNTLEKLNLKKNKKYTVEEISKNIFDFLTYIKVEETLNTIINRDRKLFLDGIIKNAGIGDEHIQVFNIICETFQKIVDILGEEKMYLEEYSKILKASFEKQTISIVPPTQDQVLIGDFSRTKLSDNRVLFVLGTNEGFVPKYKEESPFISDEEKVILLLNGIELRTSTMTSISTDLLNIYSLILKPTEKLYLFYSTTTLEGAVKKPSSVIEKIKEIFINIRVKNIDDNKIDVYSSPEIAYESIFKNFDYFIDNREDEDIKNTFSWLINKSEYRGRIKRIEAGIIKLETETDDYVDKTLIDKIYTDNKIFSSISKLEHFKKCPFAYFLKYNLNIRERNINILDYLKMGNIYHLILEDFSKKILKIDINSIDKEYIYNVINDITNKMKLDDKFINLFEASAKYIYYIERIKTITYMSANAIIEQLKNGNFKPKNFEVSFENINEKSNIYDAIKITLKNNYNMILRGKIDRVDKLYSENKEYVKIIDYKSSDKKISIEQVYYGLQLQLLVYLDIFIKIEQKILNNNILPAGAFYFQVQEAIMEEDKKENDIEKQFNMKGIVSNQEDVMHGLDINYKENKPNTIKGLSSTEKLSEEQFKKLLMLSNVMVKEIGEEITTGNIKIYPYKYKGSVGCDYCDYKEICNFEILNKKIKYNYLKELSKEEIWEKIDEKIEK